MEKSLTYEWSRVRVWEGIDIDFNVILYNTYIYTVPMPCCKRWPALVGGRLREKTEVDSTVICRYQLLGRVTKFLIPHSFSDTTWLFFSIEPGHAKLQKPPLHMHSTYYVNSICLYMPSYALSYYYSDLSFYTSTHDKCGQQINAAKRSSNQAISIIPTLPYNRLTRNTRILLSLIIIRSSLKNI